MPDTYIDSAFVGFNHQDALDARVDTYGRLSPILNAQDAPAITANFANNLAYLQSGPSDRVTGSPKIDIGQALISDDPVIKQNGILALERERKSTPEYRLGLNNAIETPSSPETDKFYDKEFGFSAKRNNEDFYYKNDYMKDGWFYRNTIANPGRFIGRVVVPAVLKFGEGLGYVGSMLTSIGSDNYWADVADNGLSKWLEGKEQSFKDHVIPVYKQAGFDDKGFFSKLLDWSFWNDSVADGVAFMASAAVPGMGMGKLGQLGKLGTFAEEFSAATKLGKAASKVGLGSWAEVTNWSFNTAMESAQEGAGVFKEVTKRLEEERRNGLNNLSDEDIRTRAGKMAKNTMLSNFAVLGMSNAFENTLFFKPFKNIEEKAAIQLGEDFTASSRALGKGVFSPLSRATYYGKIGAEGLIAEGLWEENAQLAIQRMNQGDSQYTGVDGFFRQLAKQTLDAFAGNDKEASESIGLGALIGVGAGVGFSWMSKERKKVIENTKKSIAFANVARQNLFSSNDIYERDDSNKIIYDKDNNPKVDSAKLESKQRAYQEVYGKIGFANQQEYLTNPQVQYETKRALASYVRSLSNADIEGIDSRLANLSPENAMMFGMDPSKINEQTSEFRDLASKFGVVSKDLQKFDVGKKPFDLSDKEFSEHNMGRKAEIFNRRSDNIIVDGMIALQQSEMLKSLNSFRTLNNSSLSQFPVDQLNQLIYQKKLNKQVMDSPEYKEMSEIEKEYHVKRDSDLESDIASYKVDNELALKESKVTEKGYYTPTKIEQDGTVKEMPFDKRSNNISNYIANYDNVIHKNAHFDNLFSDTEEGHNNYVKYLDTPLQQKLNKAIVAPTTATAAIQKKYRELEEGDFAKVTTLVAKMVFGENQEYSPEEQQLQANYPELIEEILPQYESIVEQQRLNNLNNRITSLQKIQESIARFIEEKSTTLGDKKVELEILQEELANEANNGRSNQVRIQKAIDTLSDNIAFVEERIAQEEAKLANANDQVALLEQEVAGGNYRGLSGAVDELKKEIEWSENKLAETKTLLSELKRLLRKLATAFKKLFPSITFKNLDRILGDEYYGNQNRSAYDEDVLASYDQIKTNKDKKQALEELQKDLETTLGYLKSTYAHNKSVLDGFINQTNQFFKDQYLDLTKAKPAKEDPEITSISKGLTSDSALFQKGVNSGGEGYDEEDGFDGDTYQRPLHTKFFTTTFPYISGDLTKQPKDVQDYFKFVDYYTNPSNGAELKKKLGKGKMKAMVVTRNNVDKLGLSKVLEERKQYFDITDPALTHIEVIPVIEEGGYLYYTDTDLNKLARVGTADKIPNNILRRSLRTVKFTEAEQQQYSQKYSEKDMAKALKAGTDWRDNLLKLSAKESTVSFDFSVTRGIPNKMHMQDGAPAKNSVIGVIIPSVDKIYGQTVRVYASADITTNGDPITVPIGRPFIYTNNGQHEQLHAADNQLLSQERVATVTAIIKELLADHLKKVTETIAKSTTFPKDLKDETAKAGGIELLDDATKKKVYLAITSDKSTKGTQLFDGNYTNFLSSVIYGIEPVEKGKEEGKNQIYIKGYKLNFGNKLSIDITNPTGMDNPAIQAFLANSYHNIKYFTNTDKADREYIEYFLDGDKISSRSWKNYSTYLLSDKLPDGKKRTDIPITTSIKTKEQQELEKDGNPYYPYISRGITLQVDAVPTVKKTVKGGFETVESSTNADAVLDQVVSGIEDYYNMPSQAQKKEAKKEERKKTAAATNKTSEQARAADVLEQVVNDINSYYGRTNDPEADTVPNYDTEEAEEFEPSDLFGTKPESKEEEVEPADDDDLPMSNMFRVSKAGVFRTEEDLDAVIKDIQRMVPQFPVIRLKNIIRSTNGIQAWGQFVDNTIKLYEMAEKGTGYHEVFEGVANRILSDKEWNAIAKEFSSRPGSYTDRETEKVIKYSEATPNQIKEQLAEEFMDYKLGKKEPSQKNTRSYFRILWDFIKSLFSNKTTIDGIFAKIDEGGFAQTSIQPRDRFTDNYRVLKDMPVKVRRDLFEGATSFMFQDLFYSPESLTQLDDIERTDESIYENIRGKFQDTVRVLERRSKTEKDEHKKAMYADSITYINKALADWKDFVNAHQEYLKPFRIKFEENQSQTADDVADTTNRNDYTQDIFKTDGKRSASKSVRFLFGTLLRLQFQTDENGGLINSVNDRLAGQVVPRPSSVFMASLANYDEFMLKALEELEGLGDFDKIESKLRDMSGITEIESMDNPEVQAKLIAALPAEKATWTSLYMRLFGHSDKISEEAAWNLKVKFQNYISKHSPEPYVFINGGASSTIISSTKRSFFESITGKIESSLIHNQGLVFMKQLKDGVSVFVPTPEFRNKISLDDFTPKKVTKFVEFLGLGDYITTDFVKNLSVGERNDLRNRLLSIRNALTNIATPTINLKQLNIFGYTNSLINFLDRKENLAQKESQFFNINNEPQQLHIIPSFVSRLVSEVNSVQTLAELQEKYPQTSTVFAESSILLDKLFDKEGNRTSFEISLGYMEGVKDLDDQEGTKSAKLEFVDKYYLQFNASLSGLYYSLPADSETEWLFNFGEFVTYSENILEERGKDIINKIFLPKLKSEMDLAIQDSALLQLQGKHRKDSDYTIGESLRFFKDILASDKTLVGDILDTIHDTDPKKSMTSEKLITNKKFNKRITAAIMAYLEKETQKTINTMLAENIMLERKYETGAKDYSLTGLNNAFLDRYDKSFTSTEGGVVNMNERQMRSLMQYHKLNTIIGNMEQFQIVFGDPAQYKDWEKRAKSLFGPVEQTFYDATGEFNNWLNKEKNTATLGDQKVSVAGDPLFGYEFSNTLSSRTINDVSVTDVATVNDLIDRNSDFVNKFINGYEEINEADGQSIGTLPMARHLMIKSGWRWGKEHEAYFQYDSALMRSDLSKTGGYKYTDANLEKLDKDIIVHYEENPPMAALSPVKTLMPYVDEDGNQNLLKHSVHFMSYQLAKEFELFDVYKNMLLRKDDLLNFKSAQKIGLKIDNNGKVTDYYENPFVKNDLVKMGNPVYKIDIRTVGVQVETQTSGKGQTLGSQLTKLSNLNMYEGGVPVDFSPEGLTASEIQEKWNSLSEEDKIATSKKYDLVKGEKGTITSLSAMKMKSTLDKFTELGVAWKYKNGTFSYDINDLTKIKEYIHAELQRLEVDENTINNIQLTEDYKSFINPAETVPSYTTISNLLWSMADKAVTSMKVNGKPYIQVASTFFNKSSRKAAYKGEDGKWVTVENKEDYEKLKAEGKKLVMTSSELKFYTMDVAGQKVNAMEVMLPNIYLTKVNKVRAKRGLPKLSPQEMMDYLNDNPKLLEGIGFRIPTQASSSLEFFKIKGFLPEIFGSAIVVPSAITTKAGSDFDVDKLNTYLNNWRIGKNGMPVYEEFKDNSNSTIQERFVGYVKDNSKDYGAIRRSMKDSIEYQGMAELIVENNRAISGAKELISLGEAEQDSLYSAGYEIFRGLPKAVKQQYFEKESELNDDEIIGAEKILSYLSYTKNWIKEFGKNSLILEQTNTNKVTKVVTKEKVTVSSTEVVPILNDMVANYTETLEAMGVTKDLIEEYLTIKAQRQEWNSAQRAAFDLKLAKIIAEFSGMPSVEEFSKLPLALQNTKGAVENRYFDSIRNILSQEDMFDYLLSPNSVEHIREMRDDVYEALGKQTDEAKELDYTRFLSTEYLAEKRNQFTKGKYDIGIFAVAMTNFANSQVTGIAISIEGGIKDNESYVFDTLNNSDMSLPFKDINMLNIDGRLVIPISVLKDRLGNLTMDKLSAYINGAVDVAKDPLIVEMGMHTELAGVYTLMERMGLTGKTIALFLYQPVVREYLREYILLDRTTYFGNPNYSKAREIQEDLALKYGGENAEYDPKYKFTEQQMIDLIRKGEQVKLGKAEFTKDEKYAQFMALASFLKMKMYSNHLLESIQGSNHDTASVRSPYILTRKDLQMARSKEGNVITKVANNTLLNGTQVLRDETSVGTDISMLKNFNGLFSRINLFALQKENSQNTLLAVAMRIFKQNPFMSNDDFIAAMREYESAMIDSLAVQVEVPGLDEKGNEVYNALYKYASQYFKTGRKGNLKSRFDQLNRMYPATFKRNFFLSNLEFTSDQNLGIDIMQLKKKPSNSDVMTKEQITEGMLQLASYDESKYPELVEFYRAVVYGAYLQNGIKFSRKSFVDLIPVSLITDTVSPLALTDITKPALETIDTEDFSMLDEQVQRSRWYKKGIIAQRLQFSVQFISPDTEKEGKYVLEQKAVWREGKSKPPSRQSQIFFGRRDAKGNVVPHIHPLMIWGGYLGSDSFRKWEDMPDIISIPAVKPEYIIVDGVSDSGVVKYKVSPITKAMKKRGDYSFLFEQLFKKVGAHDPSLGRGMYTKAKSGESMSYLYKPINKYGSRDFNEMRPLVRGTDLSVSGTKSILNFPIFKELNDRELITSINDKGNKLVPAIEPKVSTITTSLKPKNRNAKPKGRNGDIGYDLNLPPIDPSCY